jgi:hypothetical protein
MTFTAIITIMCYPLTCPRSKKKMHRLGSGKRGGHSLLNIVTKNITKCIVSLYCITEKRRRSSTIISVWTYRCECMASVKNGPSNPACTHSTPHANLDVIYWHFVNWHSIFFRFVSVILRVHVYTEMNPSCIADRMIVGSVSIMHPMKVLVHKYGLVLWSVS